MVCVGRAGNKEQTVIYPPFWEPSESPCFADYNPKLPAAPEAQRKHHAQGTRESGRTAEGSASSRQSVPTLGDGHRALQHPPPTLVWLRDRCFSPGMISGGR